MSFLRNALSMEDGAPGVSSNELEHAFYLQLGDFSVLESADEKMRIEQANFYTENKGKGSLMMRSRKTNYMASRERQGAEEITFVTKTPNTGTAGFLKVKEIPLPGSPEQHALYMEYGSVILKHRHTYKVLGTTYHWDIDVFLMPDGSYSEWTRAEIEVASDADKVPDFPFEVKDSFSANDKERRDELKAKGLIQQ